jgi:SAM-dependent methyltransferase
MALAIPHRNGDSLSMTHAFDRQYWDEIWQGDRAASMGSGAPNPHLVREIADLPPGTALDAGCGAGAEAIWLAERGWQVTAADIAEGALARAAERAAGRGLAGQVEWVRADLSVWDPGTRFDLVTTHYAHPAMPQLEFYDRAASWVAPGGTLLIVGHLHQHGDGESDGQAHGHGRGHGHGHGGDAPPAAASATAVAITERLDGAAWDVVTAQESRRIPDGHEVTLHDVVVRATRRR